MNDDPALGSSVRSSVPTRATRSAAAPAGIVHLGGAVARNALGTAVIVASAWAAGTVIVTGLALIAQVQLTGWQGVIAPGLLVVAVALATMSYALRFLRWHVLARRVAPELPLRSSFVVGTIGFALILTPGRVGEVLKLVLLRQRTSVPVAMSAPVWVVEKVTEAASLLLIAAAASIFLPWLSAMGNERRLALTGLAVLCMVIAAAFWRPLALLAPRLPIASRILRRPAFKALWENLVRGGDQVLGWPVLLTTLTLSVLARLCDGVAIYWIGRVYGVDLSLAESWFLIGSSGFLGGISMIPGGSGVAEATLIGLLIAFGAEAPAATAVALTARICIFWIWATLGLVLAARLAGSPWSRSDARTAP